MVAAIKIIQIAQKAPVRAIAQRVVAIKSGQKAPVRAIAMMMTVAVAALQAVSGIVGIATRLPAGLRELFNLRMIGMMMMIGCKLAIAVSD
jgi:hypothetical protein